MQALKYEHVYLGKCILQYKCKTPFFHSSIRSGRKHSEEGLFRAFYNNTIELSIGAHMFAYSFINVFISQINFELLREDKHYLSAGIQP